ncbi:MAG TPA: LytTR family DNA-binding domain-containing protein [Chitinophagaceae bacterium]|jgi:two-component system LytT family response regulator|nr:LytTR family DNA-binding domain-containing protein [Chitinophagaceae bacterium]
MKDVLIPTNKGTRKLLAENIIRVEARSNYCRIYLDNAYPITVAKVLHWFEDKLPGALFYRIHRTHIVNKLFIAEILPDKKLTLMNGEQFQVSRSIQ